MEWKRIAGSLAFAGAVLAASAVVADPRPLIVDDNTLCNGPPAIADADAAILRARDIATNLDPKTRDEAYWRKTMTVHFRPPQPSQGQPGLRSAINLSAGAWEVGPLHPWTIDRNEPPPIGNGIVIAKCDGRLIGFVHYDLTEHLESGPKPADVVRPLDDDSNADN